MEDLQRMLARVVLNVRKRRPKAIMSALGCRLCTNAKKHGQSDLSEMLANQAKIEEIFMPVKFGAAIYKIYNRIEDFKR